jgi:signal transduction histidine kinase
MDIVILLLGILIVLLVIGNLYRAYKRVKANLNALQRRYEDLKASDEVLHAKYLNASFEIQEEERKRISSDLHDEVGANLTSLKYNFQALSQKGIFNLELNDEQKSLLEDINQAIDEIILRNKSIVYGISPAILEQFGLQTAVESLLKRTNTSYRVIAEFSSAGDPCPLSSQKQLMIYRIIQELLNNSIKYSNRWRFKVHMGWKPEYLEVTIFDDARFNVKSQTKSLGHYNIYNRVNIVGGEIKIDEKISGLEFLIKVPYDQGKD